MTQPPKQSVLGVEISATNYGEILRLCRDWIACRRELPQKVSRAHYTAMLTVHSVMTAVREPAYRVVLNGADVAAPDGMPLAWALRSFGVHGQPRVYGPDLMLAICGQAVRLGHRIFLYGGREETLPVLCRRLIGRFPRLQIAGSYSPPFRPLTPEEDDRCTDMIRSSDPDIVFVGIGAPKQERWMAVHAAKLPGVVMFGVGAAFDFHAGRVKQAPVWMQRSGLEWLFRIYAEPRRLWKRYILTNPVFLLMWLLQRIGILRYPDATDRWETSAPLEGSK
jgi:N-acetylglucosaminyldiphosphoundecaprenol N-acetyl-beta-D-mannosaminyltransferase